MSPYDQALTWLPGLKVVVQVSLAKSDCDFPIQLE